MRRATAPVNEARGAPLSSGSISMCFHEAPEASPVPIALRTASLAAKRPAKRAAASACARQYFRSRGVNSRERAASPSFLILSIRTMSVPTPAIMHPKLAYLASTEGETLLRRVMDDGRDDLALGSSAWMRALAAWQRAALLEQRALRARALRRQPRAAEMLFTPAGLQQMTADALALHKASRLPAGLRAVADLCCGVGGDSLRVPPGVAVMGVDRDGETLRAYRHNVALFRAATAVRADVTRFEARVDGIFLDPARRAGLSGSSQGTRGGNRNARDFDEEPEPGWSAMSEIVRRFGNAVLKLGPGARLPEDWIEGEREYLGLRDECLELTIRTGAFGRPGWVRATELPSGEFVEARAVDLEDSFGEAGEPGEWFYEPVKCVVRAHLFGVLAQRHGLWQLDPRTAYLSGNARVDSPLLKRYRVVKILPPDEKALRAELAEAEIGILEIKKRGMDVSPEEWRKRLKPRGPNSGTLVFTRLEGKPRVLRVEPHP